MLEVCYGARGLSHRAGDPNRASLEVLLGETGQEERGERQRSSHGKGRDITSSTSRNSNPQWENMCLSSPRIGNQENLHSDGVPSCITAKLLLQDEQVQDAERMTRWDPVHKLALPMDMVKVVLSGEQHPAMFSRGYGSYRIRQFVKELKHTEAYSRSIEATSRTTGTRSYIYLSSRSATPDTQGTTPRTTEGRKSAMWSRPKKSTVEPTGGRNRSHHYCSGRGNSIVEESINREK